MRVCGAGGCGFQAQAVKASDGKRGLLRVSPCSMHCAAQKPRAKQQPGRIALAKYKTPVCACVSLSRDAAHTSGGYGWPASTTLLKKKIATLDGRAPPRNITTHRARGISPRLRNAPATHISVVDESY